MIELAFRKFTGDINVIFNVTTIYVVGIVGDELVTPDENFWISTGPINEPGTPIFLAVRIWCATPTGITVYRWILTDLEKWYPLYYNSRSHMIEFILPGVSLEEWQPKALSNIDLEFIERQVQALVES